MKNNKHPKNGQKGITLIALVITIIVLLILAAVSISTLTGENGILTQSEKASENTEIGKEKEIVALAALDSKMNNSQNILEEGEFQSALENYAKGETEVSSAGEEFIVFFIYTNRFYTVDKNGNVKEVDNIDIAKDPYPGDYTKNEEGEELEGTTAEKAYEINCVEDLVAVSNQSLQGDDFSGKYIKLNRTLNIESILSYNDYENTELFGDYNGDGVTEGIKNELTNQNGCCFKPIESFAGTFLGNENEIKNLYINTTNANNSNFAFIKENTGNIEELKISGTLNYNVNKLMARFTCVGGFVGLNEGNIKNSTSDIDINIKIATGSETIYGGGITGATDEGGLIENCCNTGNINIVVQANGVDIRVGGIVARVDGTSTVNNCVNKSNTIHIEGLEYLLVGGIACDVYNNSVIENCSNQAKIEGITGTGSSSRIYMGGIISSMNTSTKGIIIDNCYNTGDLYAEGYAPQIGGIIGAPDGNIISNCYNTGNIETSSKTTSIRAGGIVGNCSNGTEIKNSYNTGILNLQGQIAAKGTIFASVGSGKVTITNCYYIKQDGVEIGGSTNNATITKTEGKTAEQMKSDEIITLLNQDGGTFKKDTNNINEGYPILNRQ